MWDDYKPVYIVRFRRRDWIEGHYQFRMHMTKEAAQQFVSDERAKPHLSPLEVAEARILRREYGPVEDLLWETEAVFS